LCVIDTQDSLKSVKAVLNSKWGRRQRIASRQIG
jgi:hypothetical protein